MLYLHNGILGSIKKKEWGRALWNDTKWHSGYTIKLKKKVQKKSLVFLSCKNKREYNKKIYMYQLICAKKNSKKIKPEINDNKIS